MLIIGVVVAMHVVLALMIAVRPDKFGPPGDDAKKVVYVAPDLTVSEPRIVDGTPEIPYGGDVRPPRLLASAAPNIADFARRAGVAPGKSTRVILTVNVTELGVAGAIRIAASSGSPPVDALAIEYARALRWSPASVQGRKASVNIRLPVEFATPQRSPPGPRPETNYSP